MEPFRIDLESNRIVFRAKLCPFCFEAFLCPFSYPPVQNTAAAPAMQGAINRGKLWPFFHFGFLRGLGEPSFSSKKVQL